MATIKDVSEEFLARRSEIDALDQALAQERRAIQVFAIDAGRLMTTEEKGRRKEIGSTRQELAEALEVFSLVTLDRLSNADDLEQLRQGLERINDMLRGDLEALNVIEGYAEKVEKLISGLAKVTGKVIELVI